MNCANSTVYINRNCTLKKTIDLSIRSSNCLITGLKIRNRRIDDLNILSTSDIEYYLKSNKQLQKALIEFSDPFHQSENFKPEAIEIENLIYQEYLSSVKDYITLSSKAYA